MHWECGESVVNFLTNYASASTIDWLECSCEFRIKIILKRLFDQSDEFEMFRLLCIEYEPKVPYGMCCSNSMKCTQIARKIVSTFWFVIHRLKAMDWTEWSIRIHCLKCLKNARPLVWATYLIAGSDWLRQANECHLYQLDENGSFCSEKSQRQEQKNKKNASEN